jgi:hypothetical protein
VSSGRGPSFIFSNLISRPFATVGVDASYSSAVPAGLEPSWLKTQEPTEVARINSLFPLASRWQATFDRNSSQLVGGMSLVGAPLSPGGYYRYTSGKPTYQVLVPTSIDADNTTGVVGDVDESAFAPDANWLEPTDHTQPWNVVLDGFATPTSNPIVGTARAFIVLWVEAVAVDDEYPSMICILKQSGLTMDESWRVITEEGGQMVIIPFNPSVFTSASGGSLSLTLLFSASSSGNGYARLGAANIIVETVDGMAAVPVLDSGWIASPAAAFGTDDDAPMPTINLTYWPDNVWAINPEDGLWVQLLDDQMEHNPDIVLGTSVAVDSIENLFYRGHFDAGVFVAGDADTFEDAILMDDTPGGNIIIEQFGGTTVGGQTYGADAFRRRTISVQLTVSRDELLVLQNRMAWRRGKAGAFYFASEPDIPVQRQIFTSGWYTLISMSDPTRLQGVAYDGGDGTLLFVLTLVLEEKL